MQRARRNMLIAAAIAIAFLLGTVVGKYFFEPAEISIPSNYFEEMTLYTWKGWSGDLCFLLVPKFARGRARHDFWSKWQGKCGVSTLKEALRSLPADKKYVEWNNSPPKFQLPSDRFCDQMVEFAKSEGVRLIINPSLDVEMFSDWEPR
jgi:hypothetical protein